METVKQKATVRRVETVRPAAAPQLVQRGAGRVVAPGIQASLRVSSPSDPAEKEAVSTAQQVMRITIPDSSIAYVPTRSGGGVFRQLSETKKPLDKEKEELERPSATGKGAKEIRRWTSPYAVLRQPAPKKPLEEEKEKELKKPGAEAKEIRRWASPLALFRQAAKKPLEEEKEKELKKPGLDAKEIRRWESPHLARFAGALQRKKYEGQPDIGSNVAAEIQSAKTQGKPLPLAVRRFMEPRFRADFSNVRVHTDDRAAKLNQQVGARAFAVENQLFFGKDQFRPEGEKGRELIAHELTHTIQQGSAVQRSESVTVTQSAPVQVQRGIFEEALDFAAEKAESIPGFSMLTLVLGTNPITMKKVDRTAGAFFKAVVHLIPFGDRIHKALDEYGVFDKVAGFVQKQITRAVGAASAIYDAVVRFAKSVEATDLFSPTKTWNRAKAIFTEPIDQVKQTAEGLVDGILGFIKDAILKPLGALAQKIPHYDLLKAVMEKDPVTGDPYPRTPETVIGGFMKLAGQDDVWQKMQETKAVPKAWKWFQNAMKDLVGFVKEIPALFVKAFKSLEILDVILLPKAAAKVMGVFGGFAVRFISWAGTTVWNLLEIIFDVVKPGALGYVKRTGAALKGILKNPAPFVGNLAKAAKLGFQNFAGGFLGHLKAGLIDWLTGSLPGVYIPKGFTLPEMVKFVFSILGISWAVIRAKLVKATSETAVQAMETGFDIVKTLVTEGPAAAWDKIKEQLANLKDQVVNGIIDLVVDAVVKKGVPKLVAMFIPGAGFISAIISIYDLVMTFVQKISKIMAVVTAFIDSIVAIAAGQIGAAAGRVEKILAGLLSLAISFIAGFAGLGKVADKIMGVINKVRGMIDKALDWLIGWIVGMAKKLFSKAFAAGKKAVEKLIEWWKIKKPFKGKDGSSHTLSVTGQGTSAGLMVSTTPTPLQVFLGQVGPLVPSAPDPAVKPAYGGAVAAEKSFTRLKGVVETSNPPRQQKDIDAMNAELETLSQVHLPPLVPLLYPAKPMPAPPGAPGTSPVAPEELIKIVSGNVIAKVTEVTVPPPVSGGVYPPGAMYVKFKVLSPRGRSSASAFLTTAFGKDFTKWTDDPRELYLGPTPSDKGGSVGKKVKSRMQKEGRYDPKTDSVLEGGKWIPTSACDMSHVVDAVLWWNTNGRFTGAQSGAVKAFMNDANNYILESSGANRARGASLGGRGVRYQPPP